MFQKRFFFFKRKWKFWTQKNIEKLEFFEFFKLSVQIKYFFITSRMDENETIPGSTSLDELRHSNSDPFNRFSRFKRFFTDDHFRTICLSFSISSIVLTLGRVWNFIKFSKFSIIFFCLDRFFRTPFLLKILTFSPILLITFKVFCKITTCIVFLTLCEP